MRSMLVALVIVCAGALACGEDPDARVAALEAEVASLKERLGKALQENTELKTKVRALEKENAALQAKAADTTAASPAPDNGQPKTPDISLAEFRRLTEEYAVFVGDPTMTEAKRQIEADRILKKLAFRRLKLTATLKQVSGSGENLRINLEYVAPDKIVITDPIPGSAARFLVTIDGRSDDKRFIDCKRGDQLTVALLIGDTAANRSERCITINRSREVLGTKQTAVQVRLSAPQGIELISIAGK